MEMVVRGGERRGETQEILDELRFEVLWKR